MQRCTRELAHQILTRKSQQTSSAQARLESSGVLLRDFIHEQLYHQGKGYFWRTTPPVSHLPSPLDFGALLGKAHYLRTVQEHYKQLKIAWLTPSEIFTPHYGRAVADHLLQLHRAHRSGSDMRIWELGAGTGTLARDVLNHLRQVAGAVYQSCSYTSCEISPVLAELQRRRVAVEAGHGDRFNAEVRDAAALGGWRGANAQHCYILGLEVLDNCPHDKVQRTADGSWLQEEVQEHNGQYSVASAPISDPWIQQTLQLALDADNKQSSPWTRVLDFLAGVPHEQPYAAEHEIFLPTSAAQLLHTISCARPNHSILLMDFHALPEVVIPGRNAPLVAHTEDGRTVDFQSYLLPQGSADIFFPTDFQMLERLYSSAALSAGCQGHGKVLSSRSFMEQHADVGASRTRDGYNPLLEDYTNTSVFVGQCTAA